MKISSESFGLIGTKLGYAETTPWIHTNVLKKGVTKDTFENYRLSVIDNSKELTDAKKSDLRAMLPFLKPSAKEFYENLLV